MDEIAPTTDLGPGLVDQLAAQGEKNLMELFQRRPILQPALVNLPRLREFLACFLKEAANVDKGSAPPPQTAKPN